MRLKNPDIARFIIVLAAVVVVVLALAFQPSHGQNAETRIPFPNDWTHKHVVFTQPSSVAEAWKVEQDPRFWQQLYGRRAQAQSSFNGGTPRWGSISKMARDWNVSLGDNGTTGVAMFPAKYQFNLNATPSCTQDFVVFNSSRVGSATAPSVVAFDELYAGGAGATCSTGPNVMWAYNTNASGDTTGVTNTSVVLSLDGSKIAYVESLATGSVLHILRWTSGQGSIATPHAPDHDISGTAWSTCPGASSCVQSFTYSTTTNSVSAPFYNYANDVLYVGDDAGKLYKFTGVFNGTPAEVTSTFWPVTMNGGYPLDGPILDGVSGNIFVGDSIGVVYFVRETGSSVGSCKTGTGLPTTPPCIGSNTVTAAVGHYIYDSPIVDSGSQHVFAFVGNNGATTATAAVVQMDTQLSAGSVVSTSVGNAGAHMHDGDFDNVYYSSASNNIQGHLYVCGKSASPDDDPELYRISFSTSGTMNATPDAGTLALYNTTDTPNGPECSAITEIYNGTTDRIFLSVQNHSIVAGGTTGCPGGGGCIMSIQVPTASPFTFPTTIAAALPEIGGTSGIIADNVGSGVGESSVYFTTQTSTFNTTCSATVSTNCVAIKATQNGLN